MTVRHQGGDRFEIDVRDHRLSWISPSGQGGRMRGRPPRSFSSRDWRAAWVYAERFLRRHSLPVEGLEVRCEFAMDPGPRGSRPCSWGSRFPRSSMRRTGEPFWPWSTTARCTTRSARTRRSASAWRSTRSLHDPGETTDPPGGNDPTGRIGETRQLRLALIGFAVLTGTSVTRNRCLDSRTTRHGGK
jgi:hypothetical protein